MILVSIQLSIRCRWIHPPPPPRTARVAWSFGEGGVELGREWNWGGVADGQRIR